MSDPKEMTLEEWCRQLPHNHRFNRQLREIQADLKSAHRDRAFYKSCALSGSIPKEGDEPSADTNRSRKMSDDDFFDPIKETIKRKVTIEYSPLYGKQEATPLIEYSLPYLRKRIEALEGEINRLKDEQSQNINNLLDTIDELQAKLDAWRKNTLLEAANIVRRKHTNNLGIVHPGAESDAEAILAALQQEQEDEWKCTHHRNFTVDLYDGRDLHCPDCDNERLNKRIEALKRAIQEHKDSFDDECHTEEDRILWQMLQE